MKNPSPLLFLDDDLPLSEAQDRYAARRQALAKQLITPAVFFAVDQDLNRNLPWVHAHLPIFQDPTFLWLTGITQPHCALVLYPTGDSHLFLPPKDPSKEFWEGLRLGVGIPEAETEARELTGLSHLHAINTLGDYLGVTLVGIFSETPIPISGLNTVAIDARLWPLRLPLDSVDLTAMDKACAISTMAFKSTLSHLKTFRSETEVCSVLNGHLTYSNPFGLSFPTILASGANAAVLHYGQNDQPIPENSLILMDFGARWQGMHADISRTVPANGRYTPMQRILVGIVLDAQAHIESLVKPGIPISDLNTACWAFIQTALVTRFEALGGTYTLPYTTQPHNVGHLLGRQVHDGDAKRLYRTTPLEEGWVITNEPGLYGHFSITLDGVHYDETLGIRIEDDLLVTTTGCRNLTEHCPKDMDEIERIYNEELG